MKLYYVTLNSSEEARAISRALLEQRLVVCTNWFPIACLYRWEGRLIEEEEVVLILKTREGYRESIERSIRQQIDYTNFIAELTPDAVNPAFLSWLGTAVPAPVALP